METLEYIAEILQDGHLSIPDSIIKQLNLKSHSKLLISILPIDTKKKGLTRFSGKWQDNQDADEIIKDIYDSCTNNRRSESANL
ncbi:hypothetical protein H8E88_20635 [candidate division KSB1 bacterium]|nr:hypothetical protein [candidate division KSB1 bacterium]MBL7092902.1 hypothetical protein [candidate division KSB1 bacterium]